MDFLIFFLKISFIYANASVSINTHDLLANASVSILRLALVIVYTKTYIVIFIKALIGIFVCVALTEVYIVYIPLSFASLSRQSVFPAFPITLRTKEKRIHSKLNMHSVNSLS